MPSRLRTLTLLPLVSVACHSAARTAPSPVVRRAVVTTVAEASETPNPPPMTMISLAQASPLVSEIPLDSGRCMNGPGPVNEPAITRDLLLMVKQPAGHWRFISIGLDSAGRVLLYLDRRMIRRQIARDPSGQVADSLMTDVQLDYMTGEGIVRNTRWAVPMEIAKTDIATLSRDARFGRLEENMALVRARCGP